MATDIIEIPCPSCGSMQRIAEASVPRSGEVACSTCGDSIRFKATPHGITGAIRVPGSVTPPPVMRTTFGDSMLRMEDWDTGAAAGESKPKAGQHVACPACGHRFEARTALISRPTVLVVEDTEFFLHLATEALARSYETIGVRTAADARTVLATRPVDLVVLDLTLPDAEGTDVLRALPRKDLPVLIYTSRDETTLLGASWQKLVALGASDVVHKGINIEDTLLRKTEELLAATRR